MILQYYVTHSNRVGAACITILPNHLGWGWHLGFILSAIYFALYPVYNPMAIIKLQIDFADYIRRGY